MNQVGYQAMGQGNLEQAIAAFKLNVERHPDSANVYDSLGEAYERAGRLKLALSSYEKAYGPGRTDERPEHGRLQSEPRPRGRADQVGRRREEVSVITA